MNDNHLCPCCSMIEDEEHFIMYCPMYSSLRIKYVSNLRNSYVTILTGGSLIEQRRLCLFLHHAIQVRKTLH